MNKISQCWTQHQALPNKAQSIITPIHLIPMSIKSSIIYFPIHIHSIENQFSLYAIKCEKEERKLILLQSHFAIIIPKLCTNKNNTKIKIFLSAIHCSNIRTGRKCQLYGSLCIWPNVIKTGW